MLLRDKKTKSCAVTDKNLNMGEDYIGYIFMGNTVILSGISPCLETGSDQNTCELNQQRTTYTDSEFINKQERLQSVPVEFSQTADGLPLYMTYEYLPEIQSKKTNNRPISLGPKDGSPN